MQGDFPNRIGSIHRFVDVIAPELEAGAEKLADLRLVIDDQNAVISIWHRGPLGWERAGGSRLKAPSSL